MPDPIDNPYATVPISQYQGDKTPYQDLSWLQKANHGFSESMYNKPVNAMVAPDMTKLGGIKDFVNTGANLLEEYTPKTVSSDAAFRASDNRINTIAEQTGTATTHGSIGVGNGMYMENPMEDGGKAEMMKKYIGGTLPKEKRKGRLPSHVNSIAKAKLSTEQYNNLVEYYEEVGSPDLKFYDQAESWTGITGNGTFAKERPGWYNPYDNTIYLNSSKRDNDEAIFRMLFEELGHVRQRQDVQDAEDNDYRMQFLNDFLIPGDAVNHTATVNYVGDVLHEAHQGIGKPTLTDWNVIDYWDNVFNGQDAMYSHDNNNFEHSVHDGEIKYDLIRRVFGEDGVEKYVQPDSESATQTGEFNETALKEFENNEIAYNTAKAEKWKGYKSTLSEYGNAAVNSIKSGVRGVTDYFRKEDGDVVENPKIDWDKLYEGIYRREHRGYWDQEDYNPYIRTKGTSGQRKGTSKGSSAYGPIQITGDRLADLNTPGRRRHYWDDPTADFPSEGGVSWDQEYVDQLLEQSQLFQKYGGADMPTGGIDPKTKEDISRYNYGEAGDLSGEEYHEKYKDLSIVLLKGTYNILKSKLDREPTMEELVKHWRGGNVDEEPEYVTDVVDFYNKEPKKEKTDFTKVMGSTTYKEPILPTGPTLTFPKASDNKKDGGTVYAKDDAKTSRYLKAYRKFNDGGKVNNGTREEQFTGWVKDRKPYLPEGVSPHIDMEMLYKDKYNTELSKEEYRNFLLWATNWVNPNSGKKVNMMDEGAYDVRGFWKSGDWKRTDGRGHGSDRWKKPNHPTFSDESVYSKQKGGSEFDGGAWMDNGAFIPGFHNMHDNERLLYDFNDEGPEHLIGSYVLPEVEVTP